MSGAAQPAATRLIALFGPTGVGKTDVALALARRIRAGGGDPVAVSADALQVYRGLETLTGAADAAAQRELEHRLVSIVPVSETFSAGRYARLAHAEIDTLLEQGRTPIVVGGTGLYLRAALADLAMPPPAPPRIRERWTQELERRGPAALHAQLAEVAPGAAARIDPGDRSRIVRALELHELGAPAPSPEGSLLWTEHTRHPTRLVGLNTRREDLYARIDERVDAMVAAGAIAEVTAADRASASPTARKALGFAELLAGDVDAMKQRTRRYAKRQVTWMRKLPGAEIVDITGVPPEEVARKLWP